MGKIKQVYSLANDEGITVSYDAPCFPLVKHSSYVTVIPNSKGDSIKSVVGRYQYGKDPSDQIEFEYNLNFDDIIEVEGCNLLEKILAYYHKLDGGFQDKIIKYNTVGDTHETRAINNFTIGLANILQTYFLISRDSEVGHPFKPLRVKLPEGLDKIVISRNLSKYVNFFAYTLNATPGKHLGKVWLGQHVDFWKDWGKAFQLGPQYHNLKAAHSSILDYSLYLEKRLGQVSESSELALPDADLKRKFEKALLILMTLTSKSVKTIEEHTQKAIGRIKRGKKGHDDAGANVELVSDLVIHKDLLEEIESIKNESISQIQTLRSDTLSELEDFKVYLSQFIKDSKSEFGDHVSGLISDNYGRQYLQAAVDEAISNIQEASTNALRTVNVKNNVDDELNTIKRNLGQTLARVSKIEQQLLLLTEVVSKIAESLRL